MSKYIFAPPGYDEPDRVKGCEPDPRYLRVLLLSTILFYVSVFAALFFLTR